MMIARSWLAGLRYFAVRVLRIVVPVLLLALLVGWLLGRQSVAAIGEVVIWAGIAVIFVGGIILGAGDSKDDMAYIFAMTVEPEHLREQSLFFAEAWAQKLGFTTLLVVAGLLVGAIGQLFIWLGS